MRVFACAIVVTMTACGGAQAPLGATDGRSMNEHAHEHGHQHEHAHHTGHHRFDDPQRWAKEFDDPQRDEWQKPAEVVTLLALESGMVVADLGAGTGYFLPHLARAVGPTGKVLALDVEPKMVEHMTMRAQREGLANVDAKVVPFDDPGLSPAAVDRILIVDTWHHIERREAYAAKLHAALEPGGFVAVVDFTLESPKGPPREHRVPPEGVVRELEAGGLAARVATETLPDQYVVIGSRPK